MNPARCPREDELLDALGRGFVGTEIASHADTCPSCRELRLVAGALLDERVDAAAEAAVPAAGTMWWRIQIRRRHDVQQTARRSLLVGQAVTLAVAAVLLFTLFGAQVAEAARTVFTTVRMNTPLLIALATSLLLAPIAGWAAIRQK